MPSENNIAEKIVYNVTENKCLLNRLYHTAVLVSIAFEGARNASRISAMWKINIRTLVKTPILTDVTEKRCRHVTRHVIKYVQNI